MARKPITYARRRNRNDRKPALQTLLSPKVTAIVKPEEEIPTCEMRRRMLKRSRRSWNANATGRIENTEQLAKKPKLDSHHAYESQATISSIDQQGLQTPHNTSLTREQVFKLESSRGGALQSEECELSPVPFALSLVFSDKQTLPTRVNRNRPFSHKTSSSNLKENDIPTLSRSCLKSRPSSSDSAGGQNTSKRTAKFKPKMSTRGTSLASPFASKPSSPQSSSKLVLSSQVEPLQDSKTSLKRTLSDTHFNPNLPSHRTQPLAQARSTANSPTFCHEDESIKTRRPSAPSATSQRPDVTAWFPSYNPATNFRDQILSSSADFFVSSFRNRNLAVDFNRPPSQLSCNLDYDEAFFGDALEISTPFKPKGQRSRGIVYSDSPDVGEQPNLDETLTTSRTLHSSAMDITRPLLLDPDIFGSWVSDSLISSPTLPQEGAYSHSQEDRDTVLELDHKLVKPASLLPPLGKEQSPPPSYVKRPEPLQDLFNKLDLSFDDGMCCHIHSGKPALPMRTRSLDFETDQSSDVQSIQSPAQTSHSQTKHVTVELRNEKRPGRDRRGTIRASDFQVAGSSVLVGPRRTRSGTVVQGSRPRRERSDTIVARPSITASSKCAPPPSTCAGDVDMFDSSEDAGRQEVVDVLMTTNEEQDDELLLKDNWVDEEWVVAAPPSPVLPRRKRKVITEWRRRFEQKKASGIWGMDHDPDDGEDDPLLLK
ncbi:hypothetical protein C0995_002087 [Termitomyces sp. Mi166|nr:hypothetical protein C0995_002087 [Termitomyces sp. Mi166\